jgi:hypothetical protein
MLRACRQGLAGLAKAGVSRWLDTGCPGRQKRTQQRWVAMDRQWSLPVTAERSGARRLCAPSGAGAYDIFNENDLQYL